MILLKLILLFFILNTFYAYATSTIEKRILVIGSINADVIIPLDKFPDLGETVVTPDTPDSGKTIAGGKGANQAVSCRRLGVPTSFICQFGNDANAGMLENVLHENDIDVSLCQRADKPSGMGLVFLQSTGAVGGCVVLGGSNNAWPDIINTDSILNSDSNIACVLLQMEIPQHVNELIAEAAFAANIPVFQDIGGADHEISPAHLKRCTYLSPNLSELKRMTKLPVGNESEIIAAARYLQSMGARNILVTLGDKGSLLVPEENTGNDDNDIIRQECCPVEKVVDETGAGDNYRAAFAVAHFVHGKSAKDSMEFASAASSCAVSKMGAIPSCSTLEECLAALAKFKLLQISGGNIGESETNDIENYSKDNNHVFPFKFASRLNSMKDRGDLWQGTNDVFGWIARQGTIEGLDLVDFNYPQHITSTVSADKDGALREKLLHALLKAGLKCGAMCLRFPKEMQLGALTNPDAKLRERAIELVKEACEWALALGANEVVVWSAFDGYDYALQVDYTTLWDDVVNAFRDVCDSYPNVKVSLEYKPTDENTRFFAVPSTGAAMLLVDDVDRDNFGVTLDFGHCLMAGENPAQSVVMVNGRRYKRNARRNRLFGVQLGDGYGRLGAEDGLMFGSVHPKASLEFVLWLVRTGYDGHIYFDTFPRNEDPVRECAFNIKQFKKMYFLAKDLLQSTNEDGEHVLEKYLRNHDALGILEHLEDKF